MFLLIPRTRISTTAFSMQHLISQDAKMKQNMCRGLGNNNKINEVGYSEQIFKPWLNNITA